MRLPEVLDPSNEEGAEVLASTPEQCAPKTHSDMAKWVKSIKQAGIPPQ